MVCLLLVAHARANGSEREQVMPLIDSIVVKNNQPGRNSKRVKVLAADKGYDSKQLRATLRKRGIRPQLPKRTWFGEEKPR